MAFSFSEQRPAVPAGWRCEPDPARLMGEPLLAAAAKGPALICRDERGFLLAYLYRKDRPFPLTPLFCFARLETLEGRDYLCFPFRPGGCPRLDDLL